MRTGDKAAFIGIFASIFVAVFTSYSTQVASNSGLGKPVADKWKRHRLNHLSRMQKLSKMVDRLRKPAQTAEEQDKSFNELMDWEHHQTPSKD
jgi:hypothetical protein